MEINLTEHNVYEVECEYPEKQLEPRIITTYLPPRELVKRLFQAYKNNEHLILWIDRKYMIDLSPTDIYFLLLEKKPVKTYIEESDEPLCTWLTTEETPTALFYLT